MHLGATTCELTMADKYVLRGLHQVEIKRSIHQIIDTAKIQLPLSVVTKSNDWYLPQTIKLTDKIKEGDRITLAFGYDGNNRMEFEGYIRRINYAQPLELECENDMYLLRKCTYKKSFRRVSLKELLQFVLDGLLQQQGYRLELYTKLVPEMYFSNFLIRGANGIEVLQELNDKHGITSYMTEIDGKKVLYAGLAYLLDKGKVKFGLNRNTVNTSGLQYQVSTEPKKYKVKVTVYQKNGLSTTYEFGDRDGESYTLRPKFGNYTQAEVEQYAKAEIEKLSVSGYKGGFETFLKPYSEPGMIAVISDSQFTDRQGNYYISSVTTTFGVNGGRRKPEISIKLSV